jgi:hypothetical protein
MHEHESRRPIQVRTQGARPVYVDDFTEDWGEFASEFCHNCGEQYAIACTPDNVMLCMSCGGADDDD